MAAGMPIADLRGSAVRVLWRDGALTGDALHARVVRIADALHAAGAQRIASRLDNGPDWLALDLAIRELGRVHVPLPTFFTSEQVAHALRDCGADALVLAADAALAEPPAATPAASPTEHLRLYRLAPAAMPLPPALPPNTACITYTSGTTGTPKGVCLDVDALYAVARSLCDATAPLAPRRHLCLMPLSTLLENVAGVYAALMSGAEIAVPSLGEIGYRGDGGLDIPALLACLHRYRPESAIAVPQLLLALTAAAEQGAAPPDSLRFLAVGGARVGQALLARAHAVGLPAYEGYGLSECASVVCLNRPGAERPGSVGKPLPHARVFAVDGELWVEGVRSLGYLGEADATTTTGPLATGDLGEIDEDGYVYVTGRRKHMIITSYGRNFSPEWVESELQQHPAIAQAVVYGEARPFNVAVVWPRDPALDPPALRSALDEVNRGLPDYARVRETVRADAPLRAADGLLTANGRPRREAIYARYREPIERRYRDARISVIDGVPA